MERGQAWQSRWPGRKAASSLDQETAPDSHRDMPRLLLELQTHQIELEMQNDELRRTQNELLQARDALKDLYDAAPVGYVTTDDQGTILSVNLRFASLIGNTVDSFLRSNLSDFIAADDRPLYQTHRQALLDKNSPPTCQLRIYGTDGRARWIALESVAVECGGQLQLRSAISDITERKRAEEEHARLLEHLQQAHKMQAIGTLAGGVAHDVNNVLAVILMLSSALERGLPEQDPKRQDARDIITAVMRGKKLTQDLLDFARKTPRRREVCPPTTIIERLGRVLDRTAPKRISLNLQLDPNTASIECDPDQFMQALMNLCLNSIDAIPSAGSITITTANLPPDAPDFLDLPELPPVPHVRIEVTDDGAGMDAEIRRRAFEPFFTTKDVGKGTGLGLYMVYRAIQELGGGIRILSNSPRGTTIRILLPAHRPVAKTTVSRRAPPRSQVGRATVLVVDDEPLVRSALGRALEDLGYRVLLAESGGQALEIHGAHQREIAAVLLDLSMPVMDGAECYRRLKQADPEVCVVLCTGHARGPSAQELLADGNAPRVVRKPCTPEELGETLAEAIARRTMAAANDV